MLKTTILILCLCAVVLLAKPALDESAAKKFIEESNDKFLELYIDLATLDFAVDDFKERKDEENIYVSITYMLEQNIKIGKNLEKSVALSEEAYQFPVDQYTDEEIKIGILKSKVMPGLRALGYEYKEYTWNDDLDYFSKQEQVCKFNEEKTSCQLLYGDIEKILKSTNDESEILYYWKEWRRKFSPKAIPKMKTFIRLNKKLSEKYDKPAKFVLFRDYLDENFGENMEKVITELEPLYKEIHGYIRYLLHEQFGKNVPEDGLIPHHLYELAQAQCFKSDSLIAKDFNDVKMPIENDFKESAKDVIEMASNFMKSLGMSDLPQGFWNENKESANKGDDCIEQLNDNGNVTYFRYCNKVDIDRFFKMYRNVVSIYYANERRNLPFVYTYPFNLQHATGKAVSLSIVTPKYLHKIGHNAEIVPEMEELNRLYRMGLHTLLSIPEHFVHVKIMSDVLDGTIEFENLNKHYWDLMKKYVGVAPPVERGSEDLDVPIDFYDLIHRNKQSTEFFSKVAGYQIYKSLCKKSGDYIEGDKTHQLHNCDLSNSKEAGKLLKRMMQLGATKSWQKVLGTVTGDETGMKADGLLEYYKSLQEWLHKKNTQNGVTIGW